MLKIKRRQGESVTVEVPPSTTPYQLVVQVLDHNPRSGSTTIGFIGDKDKSVILRTELLDCQEIHDPLLAAQGVCS